MKVKAWKKYLYEDQCSQIPVFAKKTKKRIFKHLV